MEVQKDVSITYQMIPGADHFFEGRLDVLAQSVVRYVSGQVRPPN